uniref:Uncharacterized protein n=1 Tax=Opuntia streptacantha TaxID=393608 RepID=A0A7C9DRG6_OPUST
MVAPETILPRTESAHRLMTTLQKSLLSWPVAATRRTDSAAPIVLAKVAKILLAVSCEICHSNGSTGTDMLKWRKRRPRMAREQRMTRKTSERRERREELRKAQW